MWCKSLEVLNPYEALKEATMPDLKPCPFCGGKPLMKYNCVAQKKKQWAVQCRCGARFFFTDRKYKAIEAWNRRAGERKEGADNG